MKLLILFFCALISINVVADDLNYNNQEYRISTSKEEKLLLGLLEEIKRSYLVEVDEDTLLKGALHELQVLFGKDRFVISANFNEVRFDSIKILPLPQQIEEDISSDIVMVYREIIKSHLYLDKTNIAETVARGMVSVLDGRSSYLSEEEYQELKVGTTGRFGGLGIQVTMEGGFVKVISPFDDTPAQRAGIQSGDLIIKLDDQSVQGMTLTNAVKIMRGEVGSKIVLTVVRDGKNAAFNVTLVRDIIKLKSVRSRTLEDGFVYLRISAFRFPTGEVLKEEIKKLKKDNGGKLKGMVLDLRNNPGGVLNGAISVSDAFLNSGKIVYTEGRIKDANMEFKATFGDLLDGAPLVVLINGGSASASEIVAGALQDHKRAIIMGIKSFGKGTVQTILPIVDGGALKITTAQYFSPTGRAVEISGIVPDVHISVESNKEMGKTASSHDNGDKFFYNAFYAKFQSKLTVEKESKLSVVLDDSFTKDPTIDFALKVLNRAKSQQFTDLLLSTKSVSEEINSRARNNQLVASNQSEYDLLKAEIEILKQNQLLHAKQEKITKTILGKRIALVVGNSAYKSTIRLPNPKNDALAIGRVLSELGFDVEVLIDATKKQFDASLRKFGSRVRGAQATMFFYAGHGIQIDGKNYLIPVDAKLNEKRDLKWETVALNTVLTEMESQASTNLVFLDSCRDNPFANILAQSMGVTRSTVGRGLARVDAATGIMISYATKDGAIAADGNGIHSPYTSAILKHIETPGLEVGLMLRRVRKTVLMTTDRKQVPWDYGSLLGEFYFNPVNQK